MREMCCAVMGVSVQILVHGRFTSEERPIGYDPVFDEFRVSDGAVARPSLTHCPWCDRDLGRSRRADWFERVEEAGLSPDDELPAELTTDAWWAGAPVRGH